MKKFLASLLVISILSLNFAILATPKKVEAFWGIGDISFDPPTTVQTGMTTANTAKVYIGTILRSVLTRLGNKVLNKMVKKTMNWALTGYGTWENGQNTGGQPFYVQNTDSLLKNITDQQLVKTIQDIQDNCQSESGCPYGKELARTLVKGAILTGGQYANQKFNLDQYSPHWQKFADLSNPQAFSEGGGWQTWEGMYQNPNNSPFGAYLNTAFTIAERQQAETGKQQQELANNNGFLSLRKCVAYLPGKEPTAEIDFALFGKKKTPQAVAAPIYNFETTYQPGDHVTYADTEFEAIQENTGTPPLGNTLSTNFWGFIGAAPGTNTIKNSEDYGVTNGTGNAYNDFFGGTYALPGMTVDNCMRYEVTTPGAIAKEQLGKVLTSNIDKQIADSTTGNPILDSLVDMSAIFVEQGLDKLITKATTKNGGQKIFAGGIDDGDTTYLGVGNGANTNSAWYSEDGKSPIVIQDPYDSKKLHPDLLEGIRLTEQELTEVNTILDMLRAEPKLFQELDECLPGPDFGWEQRLKDEFSRSSKRLDKKSQKENNKGDKAQEAITRLERFRDTEISKTKLSMLTIIPNAIPILGKMATMTNLGSDTRQAEQKLTNLTSALAILNAIKDDLATGTVTDQELIELKKQYAGIKNSISKEETLQDTIEDKQRIAGDIFTSFDQANPKSLISKCITARKSLSDTQIGEDLGETLFCAWQTHGTESHRTRTSGEKFMWASSVSTAVIGGILGSGGDAVTAKAGIGSSPYDPGRSVQILIGDVYTQDESPFDSNGKDSEFTVDCNKYYRASLSVYEDNK